MKILCLTDFPITAPDRWLWNYLPGEQDEVHFLSSQAPDRSASWGKLLTRYPSYYRLAARAIHEITRDKYDLVVTWEASAGVPLALAARVRRVGMPPLLTLAYNPGDVPAILRPWVRAGTRLVNHMTVQTQVEARTYCKRFDLAPHRISVIPLPSYDLHEAISKDPGQHPYGGEPYIHASGRSARDYATLLEAVEGLAVKVVVHGRGYNFKGLKVPANVEIGEFVGREQFHRLVYHALFEVIPLQPRTLPIGASQAVFAMMMGRPVIATGLDSMSEIVIDGVTGLLVGPQNPTALRNAILCLLDHPEDIHRLGKAGRIRYLQQHSFETFAARAHAVMTQIAKQV